MAAPQNCRQTDLRTCLPLNLFVLRPGPCGLGSLVWWAWPQCAAPPAEPRGHLGPLACPSHWLQNPPAPGQVYTVTSSCQRRACVMLIQFNKVSKKADGMHTKCWTSPLLQVVVDELHFVCQYGVLVVLLRCRIWAYISVLKCVRHWLQCKESIERVGFSFVGFVC